LSDPELERQATDRSTIRLFRERLAQMGKDAMIREGFQRQLEVQGLTIKREVIQDATFITAAPDMPPRLLPGATRPGRGGAATAPG